MENYLLRIELRLKGYLRTNKAKIKLKNIEDLFDEDTYIFLANKLKKEYESVRKERFVDSKINVLGNAKEFRDSLLFYAINNLGNRLDKQLEEAKSNNKPYIIGRMRKLCYNASSTPPPVYDEVDIVDKVNNAVASSIEGSKKFILGFEVPRFKDWLSTIR